MKDLRAGVSGMRLKRQEAQNSSSQRFMNYKFEFEFLHEDFEGYN